MMWRTLALKMLRELLIGRFNQLKNPIAYVNSGNILHRCSSLIFKNITEPINHQGAYKPELEKHANQMVIEEHLLKRTFFGKTDF